jgi:hypothetical protein
MSKSKRTAKIIYHPPSPPRWKGRDSLELVYKLNERSLTLLAAAARSGTSEWLAGTPHRAFWSQLTIEAIRRAARFPFVILEARFTDDEWRRAASVGPQDVTEESLGPTCWPPGAAQQLMSEALVFAWHTARWDRKVARLSLGMSTGVVGLMAALTPQQLAVISARHWGVLRLRWQEEPDLWGRLLGAAQDGDDEALSENHLHAKLLFSGELLARSTLARVPA